MGIIRRFSDVIQSNLSALLDRAEDPEKMLDFVIREMDQTLTEVRVSAARMIADKKELEREQQALKKSIENWQAKAELALSRQREDLARSALQEKLQLQQRYDAQQTEFERVQHALDQLSSDMADLQSRRDEAASKRKSLQLRHQQAEKRLQLRKRVDTSAIDKALAKFEGYHQKIDQLEAQVEAYDLGRPQTLQQQFADMERDERLEAELAALKNKKQAA